jgi:ribosomal-protein-alanine N-acetyltransferase
MGHHTLTVRPLEVSDIDAAVALEARCQPRPWSDGVFRDELAGEDRVYLGAFDQALVGFGGAVIVGDEAHVTNLLVAPERRREGVGRRLLVELITELISRGTRHLTLEVRSENDTARSLYKSLGMAPVGVRPGYYGDDDALIMWAHDIDRAEFQERLA